MLACYEYVRHLTNVRFDYSHIAMGGNSRGGYSAMNIATRTDWATHILIVRRTPTPFSHSASLSSHAAIISSARLQVKLHCEIDKFIEDTGPVFGAGRPLPAAEAGGLYLLFNAAAPNARSQLLAAIHCIATHFFLK